MIIELLALGTVGFLYAKGYRIKRAEKDLITGAPKPLVIK